jgi:hypothetical protein
MAALCEYSSISRILASIRIFIVPRPLASQWIGKKSIFAPAASACSATH